METFIRRTPMPVPPDVLYDLHMAPGALEALTPPWEPVEVLRMSGAPDEEGSRVELRVGRWPLRFRWVAEHRDVVPGRQFRDEQVKGPFRRWIHTHRFLPAPGGTSVLEDRIEYALPGGRLGRWLFGWLVRRRLRRLFDFRHTVTAAALGGRHPRVLEMSA